MLGYSVVGDDVNGDGLADIAIGAPMAGAPSKSGGGAVYVVFGSAHPAALSTTTLSFAGYTNAATGPARAVAARQPLRRLPGQRAHGHVARRAARRQRRRPQRPRGGRARRRTSTSPAAAASRCSTAKPQGVHITLNDLWEQGYPYFFHVDFPDQSMRTSA